MKQQNAFAGLVDNGSIGSFDDEMKEADQRDMRMNTGRSGFRQTEGMSAYDSDDDGEILRVINDEDSDVASRLSRDDTEELKRKSQNRITLRSGLEEDGMPRKSHNRITLRKGLEDDGIPRKSHNRITLRSGLEDDGMPRKSHNRITLRSGLD